ncbi:hypothetical protein FHR83_009316 [Actinoplanes campanulatus]|uniref:ATP-dependent DNA helicase RecG n=1 Tax=Actinoplanes campanulatus TaxID=113559 RepID=A0A7W5ASV0_9ACTN|nr:hypothetical protein [Actinoplanes campanulatus]MBB3101587.1 hypothetical protein [Actinoplanes campanulatus]GGN51505.1 hypothetical protein GCM10010109_91660 [Actinoplanes campanulatus]GID42634.1 hypothetical protein Aca09nite_91400 [Actinoplanes campanulatus]
MWRRLLLVALAVLAGAAPSSAAVAAADQWVGEGLLPFPSDRFTVADRSSPTGRRVHFPAGSLPANVAGTHIDPAEWNRQDGFSPGTPILVHVPGLDPVTSGIAPVTDIGRSLRPDAPIVLLNTRTGQRTPYWAELDAHAADDPARQLLIIRPAVALSEATRYLVVLRGLRDRTGAWIPAPDRAVSQRQGHHLYLTWDFTVASRAGLTGRVLRMRDAAFAALGRAAPAFTIGQVTDYTAEQDARIARQVRGTVTVPSYLTGAGGPGSRLNYPPGGELPAASGTTYAAEFVCNIPRGVTAQKPAHLSLYGHGLLGAPTEINAGNVKQMAYDHGFLFCATSWIGLSAADIPFVAGVWSDLSGFPSVPDRLQQSFLNFLFLGRAMVANGGFDAHPAFQDGQGRSLLDRRGGLHYDGNSQGGINGGALTAIAQDWTRAVLGVPGMNYSTMLQRSTAFAPFQQLMDRSYPDRTDQQVIFGLLQMLWDRGEANGYAQHLTSRPLPGTPVHQVLMHVAFGDHQVSPAAAQVQARTIGARLHRPALAPGWSDEVVPFWGIGAIRSYPYRGSALVVWNSGEAYAPPPTNLAPSDPRYGPDPHEFPRAQPGAQSQKAAFLLTGRVIDVCGGPCP